MNDTYRLNSPEAMQQLGQKIGQNTTGGEVLELVGDVGAGKTTLVKGIALGMGITETVQSPSYTISSQYKSPGDLELHHYDFYRLSDPGIVSYELQESLGDSRVVTVVEWADTVKDVLPEGTIRIAIFPTDTGRIVEVRSEKQIIKT